MFINKKMRTSLSASIEIFGNDIILDPLTYFVYEIGSDMFVF